MPYTERTAYAAREQLEELMHEHDISARIDYVGEQTDENGWAHTEYRFAIRIGAQEILANAPYRAGELCDEPTDVDILGAVLSDYNCARGFVDWESFAHEMDYLNPERLKRNGAAETLRKAQRDYHEMGARGQLILERIGQEAMDAICERAGQL